MKTLEHLKIIKDLFIEHANETSVLDATKVFSRCLVEATKAVIIYNSLKFGENVLMRDGLDKK